MTIAITLHDNEDFCQNKTSMKIRMISIVVLLLLLFSKGQASERSSKTYQWLNQLADDFVELGSNHFSEGKKTLPSWPLKPGQYMEWGGLLSKRIALGHYKHLYYITSKL